SIQELKEHIEEWPELYVRLFPYYLSRDIIGVLERSGQQDRLADIFLKVQESFRDYREAFVWLARNVTDDRWFSKLNVQVEKILIAMIHLLDLTFRDIDNRKDVAYNRKINRQIHNYLFKDANIEGYLTKSDDDGINRVYTLVQDVKDLDPSIKIELKQQIMDQHPGFHFYGEQERETISRGGFMVTRSAYDGKQKALKHLHEVEVPQNSKEIAEALAHGDLRENAEYKAAKEKQDILNATAARMKDDLDRATIVKPDEVDPRTVSFGTQVTLDEPAGKTEIFILLGPWESEPEKGIISYLSPLGSELLNAKVGEHLEFTINERHYTFDVKDISIAEVLAGV
ncbi:MAG: transcription elongation factor GreA, partial [Spirochaetales bacterium]